MHADPRPDLTVAIEAVVAAFIAVTPDLSGLQARHILVVGLAAHGTAVASVRSLKQQASSVVIGGERRHIELGLRPDFFLTGDAPRRAATLMHELLHLDPHTPGALLEAHRHAVRGHREHERESQRLTRDALAQLPATTTLCLAHDGEVRLRQWRKRPADSTARRRFTDDDVFFGVVQMCTPADRRGGWW